MTDVRERAREARKPKGKVKKVWEPPALEDFAQGIRVRAYDQSLGNTASVTLMVTPDGVHVTGRHVIHPKTDQVGHLGSLQKGCDLFSMVYIEYCTDQAAAVKAPEVIVMEQTPVRGYRLESSLLAGMAVMMVYPNVEIISRQSAYSLLVPPEDRQGKMGTRSVVERYVTQDFTAVIRKTWNEHERDALVLGLTALHRRYLGAQT
jgi:hypothetical protein